MYIYMKYDVIYDIHLYNVYTDRYIHTYLRMPNKQIIKKR